MSTLSGDALVVAAALSADVYAVLARRVVAGRNARSLQGGLLLAQVRGELSPLRDALDVALRAYGA